MSQFEILIVFFIINLFLVLNFKKINLFKIVVDKPDRLRKFHKKETALAGGMILYINVIFYYFFLNSNSELILDEIFFKNLNGLNHFILTCSLIFILGIVDDKFDLNPQKKFLFLILILIQYIFFDENILIKTIQLSFLNKLIYLGNYSFLFTLFCFLVFLNAFNMFDGINLQSSCYTLIILIYFLYLIPNSIFVSFLIIFILFFLYLNYSNKSFLGDSGTLLISFILSVIFIKLFNKELIIYSDEILIYMLIPGIDMIRLFFERIKKKRNPFSYDRLHFHHLLLEKYNYLKTICIIILFVSLPIIANHLGVAKLNIIFISIILYSISVLILKKKNN